MTTPQQNNETNPSSTETGQVTHALLARLDRTDRALRRWRLAAQLCAGAILFGAGIAAGSAQSGKDAPQQRQGQTPQATSSQAKSPQPSPDAQDASATGGAGGAAASPQAASPAAQAQGAARGGSRMVGIALDLNPSGRWNSTLLAVDEDGIVYALNTAGPKPMWQRFTYSP